MLMELDASLVKPTFKQFSATQTIKWLIQQELPLGGLPLTIGQKNANAEITGAIIPTLLLCGEKQLVSRLAAWLLTVQHPDGYYTDSMTGLASLQATAQVLHGLLIYAKDNPHYVHSAKKAADYLCSQMLAEGLAGFGSQYPEGIPESINLYLLRPLLEAAVYFKNEYYETCVQNCLQFYLSQSKTLCFQDPLRILVYQIEACIDLGLIQHAHTLLMHLQNRQQEDGAVYEYETEKWVCTSTLAQLALCWYKVGLYQAADKALSWLRLHQEKTGGFLGSLGEAAAYCNQHELITTTHFYLEAHRLQIVSYFNRNADYYASDLIKNDSRLTLLFSKIKESDTILEIGCGNGRFLNAIRQRYPMIACLGIDISSEMLRRMPEGIASYVGSIELIPCSDNLFDVSYAIDTLEYAINPEAAIIEMIRVTKPGGWIIISGSNQSHWITEEAFSIRALLSKGCTNVEMSASHDEYGAHGSRVQWLTQKH